jgi:hypothetical protein
MRLPLPTLMLAGSLLLLLPACQTGSEQGPFQIEEATIAGIQAAILDGRLTSTELVEGYLARIAAYNGPCVD